MITITKTSEMTAITAVAETEIARYEINYRYGQGRLSTLNANIAAKPAGAEGAQTIGSVNLSETGYVSSSIRREQTAPYVAEVETIIAQLKTEIEPEG